MTTNGAAPPTVAADLSHDASATGLVRPCACGGVIVPSSRKHDQVFLAVWWHNMTLGHRLWRVRNELAEGLDEPVQ